MPDTTTTAPAGPQTYVVDNSTISQGPASVDLAVHPDDRIEIHFSKDFYDYSCCTMSGSGVVMVVSDTNSGGNADAFYTVTGTGTVTLTGQADPGCRNVQPACGAPSYIITINIVST